MKGFFILIIFLFGSLTSQGGISEEFYQIAAQPGDGIYSILRRHQLDQHSCNFDQFYKLNHLKRNARLAAGKKYFLPILIYSFNGKTIRSSIGINDWDLAIRIQSYNEEMLAKSMRKESFKKDRILWVPFHEINCPSTDLEIPSPIVESPEEGESANPGSASTRGRIFPIFGKEFAKTPLMSNQLKGKVFYIVAGHGGPDPGAIGKRGEYTLCEDEYAYDVALRLCRNLIAHGATAYMINRDANDGIRTDKFLACDYDELLWGDISMMRQQKARLFQRSNIINELYEKHRLQGVSSQTNIIIHVDSRSKGERTDLFFYHQQHNDDSKKLAQKLAKAIKLEYKKFQKNRAYHGDVIGRDLHMLRECKPLSVYIELANIRNTYDQQRIILPKNRQYLADWLFNGLTAK